MAEKWTPRPWRILFDTHIWARDGKIASVVNNRGVILLSTEEVKANARLIAAAPDLVEALDELMAATAHYLNQYENDGFIDVDSHELVETARIKTVNALAKARGEEVGDNGN